MEPLGYIQPNQERVITEIIGGYGLREKLTGMGLVKGKVVRMIQNDGYGPVIIAIGETRLGLGRGMAQKIMVESV